MPAFSTSWADSHWMQMASMRCSPESPAVAKTGPVLPIIEQSEPAPEEISPAFYGSDCRCSPRSARPLGSVTGAGGAVELFPDDVGVPRVTRRLLDHVDDHPADVVVGRTLLALHQVVDRDGLDDLPRSRAFRPVEVEDLLGALI